MSEYPLPAECWKQRETPRYTDDGFPEPYHFTYQPTMAQLGGHIRALRRSGSTVPFISMSSEDYARLRHEHFTHPGPTVRACLYDTGDGDIKFGGIPIRIKDAP